jgi:CDGSH-type Zn-finger protein
MSRLIRHDAQGPALIQAGENTIAVCQCGLSGNKPFCDGSHTRTGDEGPGMMYAYDAHGHRMTLENLFPTIAKKVQAPSTC